VKKLSIPPDIPVLQKTTYYDGFYLMEDIAALDSNALYRPRYHNARVADMICVDQKKKVLLVFQCTSQDLSDHGFRYETLLGFLNGLNFFDAKNSDYTCWIVGMTSSSDSPTNGIGFYDKNSTMLYSLEESKSKNTGRPSLKYLLERVETCVVRAPFFSKASDILLSTPDASAALSIDPEIPAAALPLGPEMSSTALPIGSEIPTAAQPIDPEISSTAKKVLRAYTLCLLISII
jgi:hypothetical protein